MAQGNAQRETGAIYRIYDSSNRLMYVGISLSSLAQRMRRHRQMQPWWDQIAEIQIERVPADMLSELERRAIICERPLYNVHHNGFVLDRKRDRRRVVNAAPYLLHIDRVARILDCRHADIRSLVTLGALTPIRLGRGERFKRDEVLAIAQHGFESSVDLSPYFD